MATFYTTREAATSLGVTVRRVRALCASGRLHANKFGRDWLISESSLEAYVPRKTGRPKKVSDTSLDY
jgi:excisionase family DNA binding protein